MDIAKRPATIKNRRRTLANRDLEAGLVGDRVVVSLHVHTGHATGHVGHAAHVHVRATIGQYAVVLHLEVNAVRERADFLISAIHRLGHGEVACFTRLP